MSKNNKDPCKPNACRIQACLQENNFQEHKCIEVLEQMRQCCLKWHDISLCCSGIDLEQNYMISKESESQEKDTPNKRKP